MFRRKIIVLISEIGRANFYYLSPARIVKCVSEYTFSISKNIKQTNKKQESKKQKKLFWPHTKIINTSALKPYTWDSGF